MSGTRQNNQYALALAPESRGEAPVRGLQGTEPPVAKPIPESPACEEQLMEEVCARGNLVRAWKRVRSNGWPWRGWDDYRKRRVLPA